jgi:predicted dehydrogenase
MEAFLDLVAAGRVRPSRLVTHRVPIADAETAYRIVTGEVVEPYLGILLEYPQRTIAEAPTQTRVDLQPARAAPSQTVRLGVIGAGSFARAVLLPALKKLDVELRGLATASAPSAQQTATRFGFGYAATDWRQVIDDESVDAVLIATRHDLHASIAAVALGAGKAVFLEKPMALTDPELEDLLGASRSSGSLLQVGFNRRFAPTFQQLKARVGSRRAPLVMVYRVNAGAVASTSWVVDPVQGGGRLVGEVCHMVDALVDLVGAPVVSVYAQATASGAADDVLLTLSFGDGSIGTIVYASGGDRSLPKEYLEVLGGGTAAVLEDFRTLRVHAGGRTTRLSGQFSRQDKGHTAELSAFLEAVRTGQPAPINPEDAAHVTRVTFAAAESIRTGQRIDL